MTEKSDHPTLDPETYTRRRFAEVVRLNCGPDELRSRLLGVLGDLQSWERPALEPRVLETAACDTYRREKVLFTSRPGLLVIGCFLIPNDLMPGERRTAVLCLPGHGAGVASDVGIAGETDDYHAHFPLQCVRAGYPTLAIEQISFGERRGESFKAREPGQSSCHGDSMAALMLGETMTGWRVWDAFRALDYLQTRPEVDGDRLVTMGISGGGLTSLFTAALDKRVTACVVSGYLNTFRDSVLSVHHCVDNYVPGLFTLCEMADIAALVAPRPLYAENGETDPIFPLAGFHEAAAATRQTYASEGVSEKFHANIFADGHRFDGTGLWEFLREQVG